MKQEMCDKMELLCMNSTFGGIINKINVTETRGACTGLLPGALYAVKVICYLDDTAVASKMNYHYTSVAQPQELHIFQRTTTTINVSWNIFGVYTSVYVNCSQHEGNSSAQAVA